MIAHVLVYIFLAIALGAMVYVVGMPWLNPKPQEGRRRSRRARRASRR